LIIESLRIVARPSRREELRRGLTAALGPIEAESGCLSCHVLQEGTEPHAIYYEAQWKAQEDLLRHVRSENYKRILSLMELGDAPPLIEFHTVAETRGFDLIERARNAS
jgi:quinol monooxygenase YgiN